jgi:hypothetical protein
MPQDTESILREWRFGQIVAERMCAAILHSDDYADVDPQCPLGGPDGLKDMLCVKDQKKYVAAAYFPPTQNTFSRIQKKWVFSGICG